MEMSSSKMQNLSNGKYDHPDQNGQRSDDAMVMLIPSAINTCLTELDIWGLRFCSAFNKVTERPIQL